MKQVQNLVKVHRVITILSAMQPSVMIMVCLLAVTCKSDLSLIVYYNERSSWLVSLDSYHLDRFLQCLCLETSIECNLRLNTTSGYATGMEMITRNQSETTSQYFSRYVCTFFYSNHSVLCKRQSRDFYDNSTDLFLVDSTSMCQLNCVEWSWTVQQNSSIYKLNNNNDITLRYNETNLTCNSTTAMVAGTSVTSTPVTTITNVISIMAKNDSQVTTVFPKHDIDEGDANDNNTTWIIIGVVVGGAAILAIVIVAIFLCRSRCERAKSRNQQDSPHGSNVKRAENGVRVNDQGYSKANMVTDQTTNDWRGHKCNPAFNHISPDQLDLGHMPFIKILVENKVYLNQSSDSHSPVQSNLNNLGSHPSYDKPNNNDSIAHGHGSEPTQIHVSKTGRVGMYSNKTTEPASTHFRTPVDPVGTYSNVHVEPVGTYSNTHEVPLGTYSNVEPVSTCSSNTIEEPAGTYSNIQLQKELPEEQNASYLAANTASPPYSLATVVNTYPVINHSNSVANEDTAQFSQLYDKLGENAAPKQNRYDYISGTMIK